MDFKRLFFSEAGVKKSFSKQILRKFRENSQENICLEVLCSEILPAYIYFIEKNPPVVRVT